MQAKTPTNQLNELFSKMGMKLPEANIFKGANADMFSCCMEVAGERLVGHGFSKQMAKHDCAEKALHVLSKYNIKPHDGCRSNAQDALMFLARSYNFRFPRYDFIFRGHWEVTCRFLNYITKGSDYVKGKAVHMAAVNMTKKCGINLYDKTESRQNIPEHAYQRSKPIVLSPIEYNNRAKEQREWYRPTPKVIPEFHHPYSKLEQHEGHQKLSRHSKYVSFNDFLSSVEKPKKEQPQYLNILDKPNQPLYHHKEVLKPTSTTVPLEKLFAKFNKEPVAEVHQKKSEDLIDLSGPDVDINSMESIFKNLNINVHWNVEGTLKFPDGQVKMVTESGVEFQKVCENLFETLVRRKWREC